MDGTIVWSRHGKSAPPVAPNYEEEKSKSSETNKIPGRSVVLPPPPPPIPEDQKSDHMKMLDNISKAMKDERERRKNSQQPQIPEAVKRHAAAMQQSPPPPKAE